MKTKDKRPKRVGVAVGLRLVKRYVQLARLSNWDKLRGLGNSHERIVGYDSGQSRAYMHAAWMLKREICGLNVMPMRQWVSLERRLKEANKLWEEERVSLERRLKEANKLWEEERNVL